MASSQLPAWLQTSYNELMAQAQRQQLAHALLLQLSDGLGAHDLLKAIERGLMCRQVDAPCGHCKDCRLLQASSHPDCYWIAADGNQIKVDQIRELISALATTSQQGGSRLVVIEQAHRLNNAAANALLKTLEEPNENCFIILCSDTPGLLPATIISRCQRINVSGIDEAPIKHWLEQQGVDWQQHGWAYRIVGGPYALLDANTGERLQGLASARLAWRNALANGIVDANLAKYTAEHPQDSLQVLDWLLSKKLASLKTQQPLLSLKLGDFISQLWHTHQKLSQMPTINYVALCNRLVLEYKQLTKGN
ncbi:DNA polymerase III subunit delta' [Paraferrimonas haliotis]|uniref:DNA-directed DNA polymerase n=1 Tax=Paraferrimonas haliotis TaxID=2013866 RepID=A0AA37TUB2_9GAMM|nr:DNA polymerase III subunit delta' [Paraferrimonas haliotis]GLS84642.1 DNA polymerase III subunit delta' [Paraferrimonas haliotis]